MLGHACDLFTTQSLPLWKYTLEGRKMFNKIGEITKKRKEIGNLLEKMKRSKDQKGSFAKT